MSSPLQPHADLTFLALTVWREARGEAYMTKVAVAYSILNRVTHPKWWGKDVMTVVFKKWQYSSLTAPHDPQLTTWPQTDAPAWNESLIAANAAMLGVEPNPVPTADSYFDNSIDPPDWATKDKFVKSLGRLTFYNVDADHEG